MDTNEIRNNSDIDQENVENLLGLEKHYRHFVNGYYKFIAFIVVFSVLVFIFLQPNRYPIGLFIVFLSLLISSVALSFFYFPIGQLTGWLAFVVIWYCSPDSFKQHKPSLILIQICITSIFLTRIYYYLELQKVRKKLELLRRKETTV